VIVLKNIYKTVGTKETGHEHDIIQKIMDVIRQKYQLLDTHMKSTKYTNMIRRILFWMNRYSTKQHTHIMRLPHREGMLGYQHTLHLKTMLPW